MKRNLICLALFTLFIILTGQNALAIYPTCEPGSPILTKAYLNPGSFHLLICEKTGHARGFSKGEISSLFSKVFNTSPSPKGEERKKLESDWMKFMGVKKFSEVASAIRKMEEAELAVWEDTDQEILLKLADLYQTHFPASKKFSREEILAYDIDIVRKGYFINISKYCKPPAALDNDSLECTCGKKLFSYYLDFSCTGASSNSATLSKIVDRKQGIEAGKSEAAGDVEAKK